MSLNRGGRLLSWALPIAIYCALSLAFFAHSRDWTKSILAGGGDPVAYVWFLNWWPFAIAHHLNPFVSNYVWYPAGANMTWVGSVPSASLLGWPLTSLGGPILAYNVWTLSAPALSAWTAFLLARYITNDWAASLVAGYLFGFSSYELGQLLGHLAIDAAFLVPLVVLFCLRRVRGEMSRLGFVICMSLSLLFELGLSTELLASFCVLGAVVWAIFVIFAPPHDRSRLWRLATDMALTAVVTLVLASPFLFYVVRGMAEVPTQINSPTRYSADLLNYLLPTLVPLFGGDLFAGISRNFTGNGSEQGAYLGLPLIFLLTCYFRRHLSSRYNRALLVALAVLVLLSLGPWLQVGGAVTPVPMPWLLVKRVPLIRQALPTRFTMYVALTAAVVTALYLTNGRTSWQRILRFALAGIACVTLVPNPALYAWSSPPTLPFFTPRNIADQLGELPNVIVLPYDLSGHSLVWQMDAGMRFTQSPAYVGSVPNVEQGWALITQLQSGSMYSSFSNDLAAYCATHDVRYILIAPDTPEPLITAIAAQHWPQHSDQNVLVVEVPDPSGLNYKYIHGDYWPTSQSLNWMGHQVTVVTHGVPSVMTLSGAWRPVGVPVDVTVSGDLGTTTYRIMRGDRKVVELPAHATVKVSASSTFVPDRIIHNTDERSLSILISLEPAA